MAAVAAIGSLLYTGYEAIAANQKSQDAKGKAHTLLDEQTKAQAAADAKMSAAASTAAAQQRKRNIAGSAQSTVLTSPQGAPPAPTQRKTLLGI